MDDNAEIIRLLYDVYHADVIDFVPTEKNRRTRLSLGLTICDLEEIVRNLEVHEYHSGPLVDKDPNKTGRVWIFMHMYKKCELYIKLKEKIIVEGCTIIRCLSCHTSQMY